MEKFDRSDVWVKPDLNLFPNLKKVAGWSLFFSVIAFILVGISTVALIALIIAFYQIDYLYPPSEASFSMLARSVVFYLLAILLLAALFILPFIIPAIYLFNSSKRIKDGINLNNHAIISTGINYLQRAFKALGIIIISIIVITLILLVIALPLTYSLSNSI